MGPGFVIIIWSVIGVILLAVLIVSACVCFLAYKKDWRILKWGSGLVSAGILLFLFMMFLGGIVMVCSILDIGAFRLDTPTVNGLSGTYILSDTSRQRLTTEKGYGSVPESEITLAKSGEAVCTSLPDCLRDSFGNSGGRFYSFTGTYDITSEMGHYYEVIICSSDPVKNGIDVTTLQIMRNNALRVSIGDPDSDDYLYYERKR